MNKINKLVQIQKKINFEIKYKTNIVIFLNIIQKKIFPKVIIFRIKKNNLK